MTSASCLTRVLQCCGEFDRSKSDVREAAENRVKNLEAEMHERGSAFDVSLKEQLEGERASASARSVF